MEWNGWWKAAAMLGLVGRLLAAPEVVVVDAAGQDRYGVRSENLVTSEFQPSLDAWGEVLDPQPLLQQWSALGLAGIDADAARKESVRSETLNREGRLTSDRAVEDAQTRLKQAEERQSLARQALVSMWGAQGLAGLEKDDLAAKLKTGERVLVRLSLPAGTSVPATVTGGEVSPLDGAQSPLAPAAMWPDPRVNATRQPGYFLLLDPRGGAWPVGSPLKGALMLPGEPVPGFTVPSSAVVFDGGQAWVFQQVDDDEFEQRPIPVDRSRPGGWFVKSDALDPGKRLVVHGAQGILSQKLQATLETDADE